MIENSQPFTPSFLMYVCVTHSVNKAQQSPLQSYLLKNNNTQTNNPLRPSSRTKYNRLCNSVTIESQQVKGLKRQTKNKQTKTTTTTKNNNNKKQQQQKTTTTTTTTKTRKYLLTTNQARFLSGM